MTRPVSWLIERLVPIILTAALAVVALDLLIWRA